MGGCSAPASGKHCPRKGRAFEPPPATSADVKDKGNAKRKRGAQEDAGEKRKRVRGPHQRKDWPNAVYCKRCNAKGITLPPPGRARGARKVDNGLLRMRALGSRLASGL